MTLHALLSLMSATFCFALACFVFFKNVQNNINRIFAFLCVSFSFWAFTEFQVRLAESAVRADFWMGLGCVWTITIAQLFHFILLYTKSLNNTYQKVLLLLTYITAGIFFYLNFFTVDFVPTLKYWGWSYVVQESIVFTISKLWALLTIGVSITLLVSHLIRIKDQSVRVQTQYILLGIIVVFCANLTSEWIAPMFSVRIPELTNTSFTLMAAFVGYAIWRHRLFTLDPASAAETIISTMSDALAVVNLSRKIEIVNKSLLALSGYTEHELLGKELESVINECDCYDSTITTLMAKGTISDIETVLIRKDGTKIPVSLSWSILKNFNGKKIKGIVFIARDMSERERNKVSLQKAHSELEKRVEVRTAELKKSNAQLHHEITERIATERKLAAEKERLTVTLKSIADGVITTDVDGKIVLLNNAAEDLTGFTQDNSFGKKLDEIYKIEALSGTYEDTIFDEILKNTNFAQFGRESILYSKSGLKFTISETGAPIRDGNDTIVGFVLVFRNITDKLQLEEELFKARKLESISLLASGIAHDFNNLLTGIITNMFMAKMGLDINSESYHLITTAEKAAFKASTLTKELLTFAKTGTSVREDISIKELIESCVGFYLRDSKSDYKLELPDDLWQVQVDRGQIDQVLNNMIVNADQSMPDGGTIRIQAENTIVDETFKAPLAIGNYIKILICDNGMGIADEHLQKIFDPYFTTRKNAVGLGLTTAFAIVQKHGGHISVQSQIGAGAVFTIYLPATPIPEAEESEDGAPVTEVQKGKGKILLVDDEEFILKSAGRVLTHLGYEVYSSEDGHDAVQMFKEVISEGDSFFAVILDLTIPGGLGAKELIGDFLHLDPYCKVVVSSGYINDPVMIDFAEYGFSAAISKPYNIEELSSKLQDLLRIEHPI
jgi:PAS domain S-box-containing protein